MELIPIFDPQGKATGWIGSPWILDGKGNYRAFISGIRVYTLESEPRFLGEFEDGMFWDKKGNAVAFIEGAEDGPVTPVTEAPPEVPTPADPPVLPNLPAPPKSFVHELTWSELSWDEFLAGQ